MDGNSSSGFSGSLDSSRARESRHAIVRRVWGFFETVPFETMRPCPERVSTGQCLGEAEREYLVYLDSTRPVEVTLDRGTAWTIEWIDGRDTSRRIDGGRTSDGRGLQPPPDGDDWLLRLKRDQ
jgi:hypothetical protein